MSVSEALPSVGSLVAGFLFGIAWLVWIDGVAFAAHEGYGVNGVHWLPGILQTLALWSANVRDDDRAVPTHINQMIPHALHVTEDGEPHPQRKQHY